MQNKKKNRKQTEPAKVVKTIILGGGVEPSSGGSPRREAAVASTKLHRNALRQARKFVELKYSHRLNRFKIVPNSVNGTLGIEFYASCRYCNRTCLVFFPLRDNPIEGIVRTIKYNKSLRAFVISGSCASTRCLDVA